MVIILRFIWKKRNLLTKVQNYILLHGFVWISLIGFTNDNLGTAARLRPVAWILILVVFVVVYSTSKHIKVGKKNIRADLRYKKENVLR